MTVVGDRYALGAVLGRSAGATVHAATDRTLQRSVAVTLVPPTAQARAETTVMRAHTAAAVSHPNLVTVLDAGDSQQGAFVVTERVEGVTLAERLTDAPLRRDEVVAMLDAVLAALERLHGRGLVVGGLAPWQVRRGVDGLWVVAALPAVAEDAAALPLAGEMPATSDEHTAAPSPAGIAQAGDAASRLDPADDLVAVGLMAVAALTDHPPPPHAEEARASLASIEDAGMRALAADALDARPDDPHAPSAGTLREGLPGGAPAGLPATVGLPAPDDATFADRGDRPAVQRLRRMARALAVGARR